MKTTAAPAPNHPSRPSEPNWHRLPNESEEAYAAFLAYLGKCAGIAAKLARHRMPLNLEILPQTEAMEYEMLCTAYYWRQRVPSFFRHLGASLRKQLQAETATPEPPVSNN